MAENIQDVDLYSIMCNETTDVKSVSEFVLCLRWVDDELEAHDEFIGLKNMPNTDADSIVWELKNISLRMDLKLNKRRGQCYDEFSTMSDSKSGFLYKSKAKRNVHYVPIATHIQSILL